MDPITAVLNIGSQLIDRLFPDKAQADAAKLQMLQLQQTGELAQMQATTDLAKAQLAVNTAEASNGSVFVAGARPFILWICGVALAYSAIFEPIARFVATVMYKYSGTFPVLDTTITMQLLFGLLGLGTMRTVEKLKGVASK